MAKYIPSFSAIVVIRSMAGLRRVKRWENLVSANDEAFYRYSLSAFKKDNLLFFLLSLIPDPLILKLLDKIFAFGAAQHFALRKDKIRELTQQAVNSGVKQVVSLGAGFDLELFKLSMANPEIQCFELDMADMSILKGELLKSHFNAIPANFHMIAADLSTQRISEVLHSHLNYSNRAPSLIIAEGLTMYLSEAAVKSLFEEIRSFFVNSSSFIFTAIEPRYLTTKPSSSPISKWLLKHHKENYNWCCELEEIQGFCASAGFDLDGVYTYVDLQKQLRSTAELESIINQRGEYIVLSSIKS